MTGGEDGDTVRFASSVTGNELPVTEAVYRETEHRRSPVTGHKTGNRQPGNPVTYSVMISSTRRFCWRPAWVLFVATGSLWPFPVAMMRSPGTPAATR